MDDLNALIQRLDVAPTGRGPLSDLDFAAKDIFDVAGSVTGCGSPDWARTHPPARDHAAPVKALLAAGARLVGKAHSDEMAFSLMGVNPHYGTPVNPADPSRVPGGSSSGSAVAVAGGLVDFAIGSDTGGSVRAPASFCGLWGIRPTHGLIPVAGTMPFAPSYDTVGWFAQTPEILAAVGAALGLPEDDGLPRRLCLPVDAWAVADAETVDALGPALGALERICGRAVPFIAAPDGLEAWRDCFRICQLAEGWETHGPWITRVSPSFGPGVRERFDDSANLQSTEIEAARSYRRAIVEHLLDTIGAGDVVVLPTCPGPAPKLDTLQSDLDTWRSRAHLLLCPAGHAGLPQVTIPAGRVRGGPVGLSLMGPRRSDATLLHLCQEADTRSLCVSEH